MPSSSLSRSIFLSLFLVACADVSEPELADLELGEEAAALEAPRVCQLGSMQALQRFDATASSVESPGLAPGFAIDNDPGTRWSSAFSDPQWLRIDLGAVRYIDTVSLSWETASSQRYELEVSHDGVSWKVVKVVPYNQPGAQQVSFAGLSARGRYLRISSTARSTEWGISLYDVSVAGDPNGACTQPGALRLDAVHSGKALDVTDWSSADGAAIQQWGYGGGNNQKWILSYGGDGLYEIRSLHSGKCLEVADASTADRAPLRQMTCSYQPNQRFRLRPAGSARYQIVASHSGKCLDVEAGSTANGARVVQWPCHDGDNQKWAAIDPRDLSTDPDNCGRSGHSCLGGTCLAGVCQPVLVSTAFQCATAMAATEQHVYVGDVGNLNRFDASGYNRSTLVSAAPSGYIGEIARQGSQLFFRNADSVQRLTLGQTAPATLISLGLSQLGVTGTSLVGYDWYTSRFLSVDRNQSTPTAGALVADLAGEYPMLSAVTSAHLYYASGNSEGTRVVQVELATGQKRQLAASSDSIFGMTAFGDTVYWSYRDASQQSGIRRLSSAPGAQVEEAVLPVQAPYGVGNPIVDASGIYHTYYDYDRGTNYYFRTPHNDRTQRQLVTTGASPYSPINAAITADSIYWLSTCHRYGGGWLYRLAKP